MPVDITPRVDALFCAEEMGLMDTINEMRERCVDLVDMAEVEYGNLDIEWWMEWTTPSI